MSVIALLLKKKPDRLCSGVALVIILVISLIFAFGCTQESESGDYYNQGIYYNNQYDKALENFNKSVGLEPGNPQVWFARSVTLYNLKRYDESLESLNKTLALDPGYGGAPVLKEEILSAMAKADDANSGYLPSEDVTNTPSSVGKGSVSNFYVIPAGTF